MSDKMLSERGFQTLVLELARLTGWLAYHTFNSRRSAPGYPDLCLVRGNVCVMAELKTNTGRVTQAQQAWLKALSAVPGIETALWRPRDWDIIEAILTTKPRNDPRP